MTQSNSFASATTHSNFKLESAPLNIGMPNKLTILFEIIFNSNDTMREKNKKLLVVLNGLIQNHETEQVNRFLNDQALKDFHPSLLKSSLIITENVEGVDSSLRDNVEQMLKAKL